MREIIPFYDALIFGTLMASLDKIGIDPMLVTRQTAKVLETTLVDVYKHVLGTEKAPTKEELQEYLKKLSEKAGTNVNINISENRLYEKINNCMWLETANFVKSLGYNSCPLCAVCVALMGSIRSCGSNEIKDFKVKTEDKTCTIELTFD